MSAEEASQLPPSFAAALASLKPTHRDVICGIAPHLFDERRRRRRKLSGRSRLEYQLHKGTAESSPLRVSAVIASWDENGVLLGQAERQLEVEESGRLISRASDDDNYDARIEKEPLAVLKIPPKVDKFRWRDFRIDTRVLKTIAVKLRPTAHHGH